LKKEDYYEERQGLGYDGYKTWHRKRIIEVKI